MNLYLTALTGVLVFLIVTVMGYRSLIGTISALAFSLGTMAWPYSKTLFRDGLLMSCTAIVMLGLTLVIYRLGRTRTFGWGLMALGLVGGGILTKRTAWVLVPALAIAIVASVQPGALNKHLRWRWVAVCLLCISRQPIEISCILKDLDLLCTPLCINLLKMLKSQP